jgi:hypothetical protein
VTQTQNPLPQPTPVLWAPRTRYWLNRAFVRLDRRKARQLAAHNMNVLDHQWRTAYHAWWIERGWAEGAPPIEKYEAARAFTARWYTS